MTSDGAKHVCHKRLARQCEWNVGDAWSMDCKSDVQGTGLQQGMLAEKGRRKAWVRPRFASCARCACCSLISCRKQCMRVACMSAWGCCCHVALSISSAAPQMGNVWRASVIVTREGYVMAGMSRDGKERSGT